MAFQDFDKISQRVQEERKQKAKKKALIAVFVVILLLLGAGVGVGVFFLKRHQKSTQEHAGNKSPPKAPDSPPKSINTINTAEKEVQTVCAGTDYKQTCEATITKAISKNHSAQPKDILKAAFAVVSEEVDKVINQAIADFKLEDPFKKKAFEDCLEMLNDAKEELNSTISSTEEIDMGKLSSRVPDVNNWLSAVLSYQQTCIDGFPDGEEKVALGKLLKTAKELGSNALAIVSEMLSVYEQFQLPSVKSRKLMSLDDDERLPHWFNEDERRLLKADTSDFIPNVTVAKDGSGNFSTINEALKAMPEQYTGRYVIYVKEGIYEEYVNVTKKMVNVTMYGDGSQKTIVTGNKNFVDGVPTYETCTFAALGAGFMAQSMGFRNTAGPEKHQAVALRVQSDRSIFVNCRMEGYQDTLYAQTHRQFYRSCYITGTIDFIFGDAAAVFQNCMLYVRRPMDNQKNIVTAQGRFDKWQTTGIVIQNCHILADDKLEPEKQTFKTYLGRPWREYSRTIIMETQIGDLIAPEGWLEWQGDFALSTLYYAEFNNKGPGADTAGRVKWPGYKVINREEAMNYTVGPFLEGESWLKSSNVPVRFGMYN